MEITDCMATEMSYTPLSYLLYWFKRRLDQIQPFLSITRKQATTQNLNNLEWKGNPAALCKGSITDSGLLGHLTLSSSISNCRMISCPKWQLSQNPCRYFKLVWSILFFFFIFNYLDTHSHIHRITLPLSK